MKTWRNNIEAGLKGMIKRKVHVSEEEKKANQI